MDRKQYEDLKNALKIDVTAYEKTEDEDTQGRRAQSHRERVLVSVRRMQALQMPKKRIGFLEFMLRQIPFMGKDLWLPQGLAAITVFWVIYLSFDGWLEYMSIRHIPLLMGVLAVVLVMESVPLMLRSYRYQMHEIETASRMSISRLLIAELILLAAEDLAVFSLCAGISARTAGIPAVRTAIYFLLPLLAAGTGCVQIIRRTREGEEISWRLGICEGYCAVLVLTLVFLFDIRPAAYDRFGIWGICTAGALLMFVLSVRMWIRESTET